MPLITDNEEIVYGMIVSDPYRWLESRELPETEAWIRDQQGRCNAYFAACPELATLQRHVEEYLDVDVVDQPARISGRYFYRKRCRGQEQASIYMRDISSGAEGVLVDPSIDGRFTSVGIYRLAPDGLYLAYEVKRGGKDRKEIRIVDVDRGVVLPDSIPLGYGRGLVFTANGYVYSHETDGAATEHTIRHHQFGSTSPDRVVFRAPRTVGSRLVLVGNACRMGVIWIRSQGPEMVSDFAVADLVEAPAWSRVFREKRLPYHVVLCHELILAVVQTTSGFSRLIELSANGEELRTLVPEKERPIRQLAITRNRIFVSYLERGVTTIDAWLFSGRPVGSLGLPAGGTIQISAAHGQHNDSFFYSFESFDTPPTIYEHFAQTNTSELWCQRSPTDRARRCHIQEAEVTSKDGTVIPLTIVSSNPNDWAGHGPVIMTTYGGFGVAMTPQFSVLTLIMMELGAVFAVPHIRGGGEFGKAWHDAGRARNRQKAIDDFLATAEWLCKEGVTTPNQLAIFGGSNSGLLVGAAMTQRPDLFAAVLCIAPLLDMLRYEALDQAIKWQKEYGTIEDIADFRALYAYSPYHHVAEDIDYPAVMFASGDKDDRCNAAHVRKMAAARLQERVAQKAPVIVDYSEERGHSPVLPLSVRIPALARRIAFLCRQLKVSLANRGFV